MSRLREFFASFVDVSRGMMGLEGRERLSKRLKSMEAAVEAHRGRHPLGLATGHWAMVSGSRDWKK